MVSSSEPSVRPAEGSAADGLGHRPSGPAFTRSTPKAAGPTPHVQGPPSPPTRPTAETYAPPRSRLPGVLTATAVLLVIAVTAVATVLAQRSDPTATRSAPTSSAAPSADRVQGTRMDFTAARGSGQVAVLSHTWRSPETGSVTGSALLVEVELVCRDGEVDYDPYSFQAFDFRGALYDVAMTEVPQPQLATGTLYAGDTTRGFLRFDLPRGEVTLLMSDPGSEAVTALRIPG